MPDPFAALGLEPNANTAQVKSAFREMARSLHPDAGGDPAAFASLTDNYRTALQEISERRCLTCHGTGKVQHTAGFTTINMLCPTCGGDGRGAS